LYPQDLGQTRCQRTMLGRSVKRYRLIQMPPALRGVPGKHRGTSHEPMPDHERDCCPLLRRERQELRREIANDIAVERHKVTQNP
jgi:hypothetical protein